MGGTHRAFLTTHWSLIDHIQAGEDRDRALINLLLQKYWKPVYCYLRRKGYDNEEAKDLTQGFFHEVVLSRSLVLRADPSKGRFRSFLLHALNQYVINQKNKQTAGTRIPPEKLVSLESMDLSELPQDMSESEPDTSFNYVWGFGPAGSRAVGREEQLLSRGPRDTLGGLSCAGRSTDPGWHCCPGSGRDLRPAGRRRRQTSVKHDRHGQAALSRDTQATHPYHRRF